MKEKVTRFRLIFGRLGSCCMRWSVGSCRMGRMLMIPLIFIRKLSRRSSSFPSILMIRLANNLWRNYLFENPNSGRLKSLPNLRIIFTFSIWIGKNLPKRKLHLLLCRIQKIRGIKIRSIWKWEISSNKIRKRLENLKFPRFRIGIKSFDFSVRIYSIRGLTINLQIIK